MDKDRSRDTRQTILDAAVGVFSENGFDGARVDAIAARAGVNKAMLYYYFESKEKLFEELIRRYKEDLKAIKDGLTKELTGNEVTGDERLEAIFNGLYDFMYSRRDILRVILMESLKSTSNDDTVFNTLLPSYEPKINRLREKGLDIGDAPDLMVNHFFFMIFPAVAFVVLGDRWATLYGFGRDETKARFLEGFKRVRREIVYGSPDA